MTQEISYDVRVSVETFYQSRDSETPSAEHYFAYRITIANHCSHDIQLLNRQWFIVDTNMHLRDVEGEGVVGQQPVIPAGGTFQYVSVVDFQTEIGMMWGTYIMQDVSSKNCFEVDITEFTMMVPWLCN